LQAFSSSHLQEPFNHDPSLFDWFTWFWWAGRFMSAPLASHDLADRLEHNRIACQKKLKEHQCRALLVRHVFASQRPAMVIFSDPGDQAVGRDDSFA
jgi:hypothetical protein